MYILEYNKNFYISTLVSAIPKTIFLISFIIIWLLTNSINMPLFRLFVKFCKYFSKNPKVFRNYADIHYIYYKRCAMSNFTISSINGVCSYTSSNIYSYLGRLPANSRALKEAFAEFNVIPTGKNEDLKKLNNAMYAEYSNQVQEQIENQNSQNVIPWASLCAKIGIRATGDRKIDYENFNNAIQLLSQSAIDGPTMSYFASLRSEAQKVFGQENGTNEKEAVIPFDVYKAQFLS